MTVCGAVRDRFTDYLDGRLNGSDMQHISAHLNACQACTRQWEGLRGTQGMLAALGPAPEPRTCSCEFAWPSARSGRGPSGAFPMYGIWHGRIRWGRSCFRLRPVLPARFYCWEL